MVRLDERRPREVGKCINDKPGRIRQGAQANNRHELVPETFA